MHEKDKRKKTKRRDIGDEEMRGWKYKGWRDEREERGEKKKKGEMIGRR
jgi:hypothetical protein